MFVYVQEKREILSQEVRMKSSHVLSYQEHAAILRAEKPLHGFKGLYEERRKLRDVNQF